MVKYYVLKVDYSEAIEGATSEPQNNWTAEEFESNLLEELESGLEKILTDTGVIIDLMYATGETDKLINDKNKDLKFLY